MLNKNLLGLSESDRRFVVNMCLAAYLSVNENPLSHTVIGMLKHIEDPDELLESLRGILVPFLNYLEW